VTVPTAPWQVPAYEETSWRPRQHRYAVCIPVLNEGERIRRQLQRMQALSGQADVIIADGGSQDGALDPDYLQRCGVRTLLTKTGPGKLSAQMRMAMAFGMQEGYDGLVFIDGNDKDDPAAIPAFIAALEASYDHVQGSRFIPGGQAIRTPPSRLWGVKLIHAPLIRLASGFPYTDTTNGFRAYSRRLLTDPQVAPFRDVFAGYELHYYLAIRAAELGLRVTEIPVTRAYPAGEKAPTKISPWRGNWLVMRTLLNACRHAYDPPKEAT
jgi:dolichol-phosphate mannosyltransferase